VITEGIGANSKAALGPLADLISPRTGIIRNITRVSRGTEEPSVPVVWQCVLSQFDYRTAKQSERMTAGKGETEREAMLGAIGEALERYCSYQHDASAVFTATAAELGAAAIRPADFVLYSDRQYATPGFNYARPGDETPIGWIRAVELPNRTEAFAPSSLIHLYFDVAGPNGFFCPPTSNGLAAGPSLNAAILGGLYELIERDAFLVCWMNRLPARRVDDSSLGGVAASITAHYARFGVEAHVFDITTDIPVTAMMALAVDRSGDGPAVVVGLGCHLKPAVALTKALMEVCQVRPSQSLKFAKDHPAESIKRYQDVKTLEDHASFAGISAHLHEFDFLLSQGHSWALADVPDRSSGDTSIDLETVIHALRAAGCRVGYVDLTTPDVAPYDVRVVRAIATGLQPIHFGFGEERLGGRRLFETPARMGHGPERRREDDLNPCPHPLP
jgi:ribosomal protein S12 methylthiotransferase accessory factor